MSRLKIKWIMLTAAGVLLGVAFYLLQRFVF